MTSADLQQYLDFAYIAAVVLFILSLKFLSSPARARWGVLAGEIGAALAVTATLLNPEVTEYKWIIITLIIGAGVGIPLGLGAHHWPSPERTALEPLRGDVGRYHWYRGILRRHCSRNALRNGRDFSRKSSSAR